MNRILLIIASIILILGTIFYFRNLRGIGPAVLPPNTNIVEELKEPQNETNFPLSLPKGFKISIFANGLNGPRDLEKDPNGNLVVSLTSNGQVVSLPDKKVIAEKLNKPHGIAFKDGKIYIAETNQVSVYDYNQANLKDTNKKKIIDLPSSAGHFTRSIIFKGDKLLTSVGSSCNVCNESDWRRASILVSNPDGSDLKTYASGLRNAVFMTIHPKTGDLWVTEMGRDLLGDDIPPDEINIVKEGKDYGWPYCYGKNFQDKNFSSSVSCTDKEPSIFDLQAHSAPLGLAFWKDSLLVAFHGSWNRSVPTGYKIVKIDPETGKVEDFITGWLSSGEVLGRPVDILVDSETIFISDDKAGVVYKLEML